ncbi:MAG: flagellar hook-length control protein FliK, partial [Phycisphaerales bacterium]|nr:flagellar hook-length control protein FliK [Phycisphaerales bacterium]
ETTQEQATQANDAAFRLLENQSDQAKLTIKSVSRSLTHAAQANLASLAVETRLGQNQLSNIPVSQEQAQAGQQAQDLPKQETSGPALTAADDSEPNEFSGRNPGSNRDVNVTRPQLQVQHRATHNAGSQQPQVEQQSQTYPAQANTTQSSAQQTDAAGVVSQAAPNLHINADQQRTTRNASQVASVQRAQSNQAVRAITSIDSGNISQQQRDTTQGSLVENMNKTELPSETKRASVLAQVQRGLASLMRSGDSEMTLKLTPGHLGEIRIQIKTNGDRLGIRFETSTQEASEFLKNSVNELSSALRSKGISLEQIQIDRAPTPDEPNARPQDGVGHAPDHQQGGQDAQRHPNDGHPDQSPNDPFAGFNSDQNNESQAGQPESIWSQIGLDAIA